MLQRERCSLAAGDNVGASPPNSALLDDTPTIDVENAWGMDATAYGNHEFDFGVERISRPPGAGRLPVPRRRTSSRRPPASPDWVHARRRSSTSTACGSASSAPTVKTTPELVQAGATAGLTFLDEAAAIASRVRTAAPARRQGADRRHPRGRRARRQRHRRPPGRAVAGPDRQHRRGAPGHDGRRRVRRPHPPHRQLRRRAASPSPRASTPAAATRSPS